MMSGQTRRTRAVGAIVAAFIMSLAILVTLRLVREPRLELPIPDLSGAAEGVVRAIGERAEEVRRSSGSADSWGELGMVLLAHHWRQEALRCFESAHQQDASEFRWLYYTAVIHEEDDLAEAVNWYAKGAELQPLYGPLRQRWAQILTQLGRVEDAVAQFRAAANLLPEDPGPQLGMGRLALHENRLDDARQHFERAVAIAPGSREARAELARLYFRLNRVELARENERYAARLAPSVGTPDPLLLAIDRLEAVARQTAMVADRRAAQGDLTSAAADYRKMMAEHPGLSRPRLNLATILMMQGDVAGGLALYREVTELFPEEALGFHGYAAALENVGRTAEAETNYRRCLQIKPDYAQAHHGLALLLEKTARGDEAIQHYRAAIAADPGFAPAQLALGIALQRAGQIDEGIEYLRNAVKLAPNDPVPQGFLDRAMQASGTGEGT